MSNSSQPPYEDPFKPPAEASAGNPPPGNPPPPGGEKEEYKSGYRDGFKDANQTKKAGEGDDKKEEGDEDKKEGGGKKENGDDKKDGGDQKEDGGDKKKKGFHPSLLAIVIGLVVLTALVIGGLAWWHHAKTHVSTDDAYTTAHVHQISPRVAGTVIEVWVDDNQLVKEGTLLVKLDPRDYEVGLQRAQANLAQAKAQILQAQAAVVQARAGQAQADAGVAQARAQADQAGSRYEVAGIDYGRTSSLYGKDLRAVAKADVDTGKSNLDSQKAGFEAAKANVQASEASAKASGAMVESRQAELEVSKSQVDTAEANVTDAKLQLSYCWVLAPCDGRVSRKTVEVGQRLSPGSSILAVTENNVWVLANLKETQLEHVRVGQRVRLPVDAFPKHPFMGKVDSIQAGSGATYSLLPPDNATGNFTKIVQRVPVKIVFDRGDGDGSIKGFEDLVVPGLSVVPVIEIESASDRGDHVAKDNPAPSKGKNQQ